LGGPSIFMLGQNTGLSLLYAVDAGLFIAAGTNYVLDWSLQFGVKIQVKKTGDH
jgi:hypothetical protein